MKTKRRMLTLGLVVMALAAMRTSAQEAIDLGSRLELFVDDYLIDTLEGGARLRLNEPAPQEIAVVHDAPCEGNICFYHTVFQDDDLYRMYYRGAHHDWETNTTPHQVVCYAESDDGIAWRKPELGIVEFQGSKANNILWNGVGSHNFAPFKDPNPNCKSDERYKAVGSTKGGLVAFKSADGIHWSLIREEPVITEGAFDSQNLAFWDTLRGRYVDFHRGFKDGVRDIMTCTSDDSVNWTKPVWLTYPGAPKEHLYTNQITQYFRAPHLFMGFPKRFVPTRKSPFGHQLPGVSDGVFMTSRDGLSFHRWREAFLRPGLQQDRWVCRNNGIAWGIVKTRSALTGTPDELSIYAVEGYYSGDDCQLRRYTLRLDGFASLNAPMTGGEMATKPLVFEGKELVLNFATSAAGSIRVEIQDAGGTPLDGFALDDCTEIFGDEIERVVTWNGGSDVSAVAEKPVCMRFELKDADLYSVRFR